MFYKSRFDIITIIIFFFSANIYGQTINELQKMRAEYEKIKRESASLGRSIDIQQNRDIDGGLPLKATIEPYKAYEDEQKNELDHFGYDFFTLRDSVSFWENLPTLPNYILGPGDELVVSIWGQTLHRESYIISRDGKTYDEKIGLLNLTGKTIAEARKYLKTMFGQVYATLNGSTPTSFIDVSMGELRSINVNFVGEVKYPGLYPVHPFSTVITGLIQAGGVDTLGSLRLIEIKRNGKVFSKVDLYDFFLNGETSSNIQLRDQDVVIVPTRQSLITIDSSVFRPGIYEGINGESIFDMIKYAGGKRFDGSDNIGIKRLNVSSDEEKNIYKSFYLDIESTKLVPAMRSDHITILPLFKEINKVEIFGQVKNPGEYYFSDGMTIYDLLVLSSGFEDSSYWKSVYHNQAEIIRRNPSSEFADVIEFDLNAVYKRTNGNELFLKNLDRIVIHANPNYFEKLPVYINGEVSIPGAYPLITTDETLESILNRAGGLTKRALTNGISIFRDKKYFISEINNSVILDSLNQDNNKVRVAWHNQKITLMPGDSIYVTEITGTVNVSGQVYNPGLIEYRKNQSLGDYINSAGGITERGNPKSIIVIYANGVISPNKWYSRPKIEDGSTIIVNEKLPQEPFNITQFATNWTSIVSSMITAIVLGKQL